MEIKVIFDPNSQQLRVEFDKDRIKNPAYAVSLLDMARRWFETQMVAAQVIQTGQAMQEQMKTQQVVRNLLRS